MDERQGCAGKLMQKDDWPYGLRCGACDVEIADGERYSTLLEGFLEDVPLALVVCVACGHQPTVAA